MQLQISGTRHKNIHSSRQIISSQAPTSNTWTCLPAYPGGGEEWSRAGGEKTLIAIIFRITWILDLIYVFVRYIVFIWPTFPSFMCHNALDLIFRGRYGPSSAFSFRLSDIIIECHCFPRFNQSQSPDVVCSWIIVVNGYCIKCAMCKGVQEKYRRNRK